MGRTVVLGGGTGGLVAARELRDRLPADHRVVLVDRRPRPRLPAVACCGRWWASADRASSAGRSRGCRQKGIEFRHTEAEALDLDNRVVVTTAGDLDYDSLVVSLGARLAPETVAGFDEMAYNLYTTEGCARIHAALAGPHRRRGRRS